MQGQQYNMCNIFTNLLEFCTQLQIRLSPLSQTRVTATKLLLNESMSEQRYESQRESYKELFKLKFNAIAQSKQFKYIINMLSMTSCKFMIATPNHFDEIMALMQNIMVNKIQSHGCLIYHQ